MRLHGTEPPAGPWRVQPVAEVAAWLRTRLGHPLARPAVLAVDGRSAGGKSTFADLLRQCVPRSWVVHTDDVAWYHSFFDWAPLLAAGVLEPVRRGEPVSFRPPGWQQRSRPGAVEVPAGLDLLVVEGVGSSRRELTDLVDGSVWVQSDADLARRRGVARDGGTAAAEDFWAEWEGHELPFLEADRPWQRALLVVNGTPPASHDAAREVAVADGPLHG
ncbi:MAG TPA: hypothetical protein VFJ97_02885 [Dermatophilaceae bacterium]|nr:hypothetical protein [Dermatophilaceae bacterium]